MHILSERGQRMTHSGNTLRTVREAPGKTEKGLLLQEYFVPWVVLGYDFGPTVLNIYTQFMRHDYTCWMQSIAMAPNLVSVH